MKKQFNLEDWLKDKSQKVVTRCGFPVRIVCTDVMRKDYPILALVERDDQEEYQSFTKDGRFSLYNPLHDNFDLFIETDEVSEDEMVRKEIINYFQCQSEEEPTRKEIHDKWIAWLEKQKEYESTDFEYVWDRTDCGELTSALDKYSEEAIINMCHAWYDKGIELERKSWLERQGEHANFLSKIQVGDKVTRNENGVLVNLSQLKRVAKPREKQGEKKPLGYVHHIDEDGYYTKEAILEPNPYTGTGFDYNGHHWGMCARDGGVEILMDGNITSRVFPDKNNIIEQKPTDSYCQENCKGFQETGKCFADGECKAKRESDQKPEENKGNIGGISPNWSEEDERKLNGICMYIMCSGSPEGYTEWIDWFKSLKGRLKPQNRWKPSDDDIIILEKLIKGELEPKVFQATLQGILEQLKKLKDG